MASRRKAIDFGANPYATQAGSTGGEIEILNDASRSIANGERVQMITANKHNQIVHFLYYNQFYYDYF